ncbi:unnamed protein product [Pylaiella littoralis]
MLRNYINMSCQDDDPDAGARQLLGGKPGPKPPRRSKPGGGTSPLHLASCRGHVGVVHELLIAGADASRGDQFGYSALHLAAKHGFPDVITELLSFSSVDVDLLDESGETALHTAARYAKTQCMARLLGRGGDPTVPSKSGRRAADVVGQPQDKHNLQSLPHSATQLAGAGSSRRSHKLNTNMPPVQLPRDRCAEERIRRLLSVAAAAGDKEDGWMWPVGGAAAVAAVVDGGCGGGGDDGRGGVADDGDVEGGGDATAVIKDGSAAFIENVPASVDIAASEGGRSAAAAADLGSAAESAADDAAGGHAFREPENGEMAALAVVGSAGPMNGRQEHQLTGIVSNCVEKASPAASGPIKAEPAVAGSRSSSSSSSSNARGRPVAPAAALPRSAAAASSSTASAADPGGGPDAAAGGADAAAGGGAAAVAFAVEANGGTKGSKATADKAFGCSADGLAGCGTGRVVNGVCVCENGSAATGGGVDGEGDCVPVTPAIAAAAGSKKHLPLPLARLDVRRLMKGRREGGNADVFKAIDRYTYTSPSKLGRSPRAR